MAKSKATQLEASVGQGTAARAAEVQDIELQARRRQAAEDALHEAQQRIDELERRLAAHASHVLPGPVVAAPNPLRPNSAAGSTAARDSGGAASGRAAAQTATHGTSQRPAQAMSHALAAAGSAVSAAAAAADVTLEPEAVLRALYRLFAEELGPHVAEHSSVNAVDTVHDQVPHAAVPLQLTHAIQAAYEIGEDLPPSVVQPVCSALQANPTWALEEHAPPAILPRLALQQAALLAIFARCARTAGEVALISLVPSCTVERDVSVLSTMLPIGAADSQAVQASIAELFGADMDAVWPAQVAVLRPSTAAAPDSEGVLPAVRRCIKQHTQQLHDCTCSQYLQARSPPLDHAVVLLLCCSTSCSAELCTAAAQMASATAALTAGLASFWVPPDVTAGGSLFDAVAALTAAQSAAAVLRLRAELAPAAATAATAQQALLHADGALTQSAVHPRLGAHGAEIFAAATPVYPGAAMASHVQVACVAALRAGLHCILAKYSLQSKAAANAAKSAASQLHAALARAETSQLNPAQQHVLALANTCPLDCAAVASTASVILGACLPHASIAAELGASPTAWSLPCLARHTWQVVGAACETARVALAAAPHHMLAAAVSVAAAANVGDVGHYRGALDTLLPRLSVAARLAADLLQRIVQQGREAASWLAAQRPALDLSSLAAANAAVAATSTLEGRLPHLDDELTVASAVAQILRCESRLAQVCEVLESAVAAIVDIVLPSKHARHALLRGCQHREGLGEAVLKTLASVTVQYLDDADISDAITHVAAVMWGVASDAAPFNSLGVRNQPDSSAEPAPPQAWLQPWLPAAHAATGMITASPAWALCIQLGKTISIDVRMHQIASAPAANT